MAFKATDMQQKAIGAKGNVLVAAAAGSGKTAVLVERVVGMLSDKDNPVSADRLLIVTFTNAAAAEMRSRIESRLYEECLKHPDNVGLIKQKQLISGADICTIDSFCINLVRENFEKCGVAPDFKIGNRARLDELSAKVMAEITDGLFKENTPALKKLLEITNCENDDSNLTAAINKIYTYSRQLPFPERFINALKKPYITPFNKEHSWYKAAFSQAQSYIDSIRLNIEMLTEQAVKMGVDADSFTAYAEKASLVTEELSKSLEDKDWDSFRQTLSVCSFASLPRAKDPSDPYVQSAKDTKKKATDTLKELSLLFNQSGSQTEMGIAELKDAVELFCDTLNAYAERLFDEFNRDGNFDFYNTEQLALSLLCECDENGEISVRRDSKELILRYDEVLVDEFQDVNDLQNMLFYALSDREKKLFVVGDLKQSIYGFRGSNPKNFLSKKNRYVDIDSVTDKTEPKKIILSDNFRSRKGVCDYVNYFFSLMLNGELGDFVYDSCEYLNAAAEFPENGTVASKMLFVDMAESEDEQKLLEYEAAVIAKYIADTVALEKPLLRSRDGALRKATYGDFAILVNALKNKGDTIALALKDRGIPVSLNSCAYTETAEISLTIALLKVIDNPKNDAELLAVMLSPVFGFTVQDMAEIRAKNPKGDIYSALIAAAENGNIKAIAFKEKLTEMRNIAAVMPIESLINRLINSTGILDYMSALNGGSLRRSNLLALITYAEGFYKSNGGGIGAFVRYMQNASPENFKSVGNTDDNSVKIMTMHASKGLQFPICIIAGNTSAFNNADSVSRILFSECDGISFKYYDELKGEDVRLLGHMITAKKASYNTIEEKMRLLYVAMTRAEDILVTVSSSKNAEKTVNRIAKNTMFGIKGAWLKETNNINDWLVAATLYHPDGKLLRSISEINVKPLENSSRLEIIKYSSADLKPETEIPVSEVITKTNREIEQAVSRNINFSYPFEALKNIQAKASASVVANKAESVKYGFTERPSFMLKNGLTAAEKGTAVHKIMQFIDMSVKPDVNAEIERLYEWGFISENEARSVDKTLISNFFQSKLFSRILNSTKVKREMRFMTEMPASRLDSTLPGSVADTPVIIQGAVDLCFDEGDGIVVLDYKTDRADNEQTLKDTYSEQLEIYSRACAKIWGKPVKEKIIYSFALSKEILL